MAKGILKFANVAGADVTYNDREVSTETGTTLSVYLNKQRVDLARADLSNVSDDAVRSKVADELDSLAIDVNNLKEDSAANAGSINLKKTRTIGLIPDYPVELLKVVKISADPDNDIEEGWGVQLAPFMYYNGTELVSYNGGIERINAMYAGKAVYIGIDANGIPTIAESNWEMPLYLGSIYVNIDGTLSQAELSVSPYLADSSSFARDHPTLVNDLDLSVSNKFLQSTSYSINKEGINYINPLHPSKKLFPAMTQVNFKYFYPNWNFENEEANKSFTSAVYYNTTTGAKTILDSSLGTTKFVVYRGVLIETGQVLMMLQQVASESDLFNSVEAAELGISDVKWDFTGLSSRAIYLDEYILASADLTVIKEAKVAQTSNVQNITNIVSCYGYADVSRAAIGDVNSFKDYFPNQEPTVGGYWFGQSTTSGDLVDGTEVNIINSIENDGSITYYPYSTNLTFATMNSTVNALNTERTSWTSKIAYYNGYFSMTQIGDHEYISLNDLTIENNGEDFLRQASGYLVFDAHGAMAKAMSFDESQGKVMVMLFRNINDTGVQSAAMIERTGDHDILLQLSLDKNMFYIKCTDNNAEHNTLRIFPVYPNDIPFSNPFTFEITVDIYSASAPTDLITKIVFFDINTGKKIFVNWVDGSKGIFTAGHNLIGITVRRTFMYSIKHNNWVAMYLANIGWSLDKSTILEE